MHKIFMFSDIVLGGPMTAIFLGGPMADATRALPCHVQDVCLRIKLVHVRTASANLLGGGPVDILTEEKRLIEKVIGIIFPRSV